MNNADEYLELYGNLWTDLKRGRFHIFVKTKNDSTMKVNESHFKSLCWHSTFNLKKLPSQGKISQQRFPSVVTCSVDGKLRNKVD